MIGIGSITSPVGSTNSNGKTWGALMTSHRMTQEPSLSSDSAASIWTDKEYEDKPQLGEQVFVGVSFLPSGRVNASVFKAEGFSEDNPVFIVKGTNTNGTPFFLEVNANSVDPRNATLVEMLAINGLRAYKGFPRIPLMSESRLSEVLGGSGNPNEYAFTRTDWTASIRHMLEVNRASGKWDTVLMAQEMLDFLSNRPSKF